MRTLTTVDSPVGPLRLVAEDGRLVGLYLRDHRHAPDLALAEDDDALPEVREQLAAYFRGELRAFDVPVAVRGTGFQREVWAVLATIPYGETWSYAKLAAEVGRPRAVRAVGLANGRPTRCRSSSPATASSARTAPSPGTAAGWPPSSGCSSTRPPTADTMRAWSSGCPS